MEVRVKHLDKARFEIEARTHVIYSDQPVETGGDDTAMTPPELFLASLASCAAYYAAQFLLSRKLAERGLEVSITAEKLKNPARLDNLIIHVLSPVRLTSGQTAGMERSVHKCLIHQTLLAPPKIDIKIDENTEAELTGGARVTAPHG